MLKYCRLQWWRRDAAGWTLAQLVMGLAISGIGIGAAFAMLNVGRHHVERGETVTGLQQHSRTVIEWIVRELRESASDSIVIAGISNNAIAFASARDDTGEYILDENRKPLWQRVIAYYWKPGTTDLYRYVAPKTNWTTRFSPAVAVERTLGEKVSSNVVQLSFEKHDELISVTLETLEETASGATAKNTITTETMIRNQL